MLLSLSITTIIVFNAYSVMRLTKIRNIELNSDISLGVKSLSDYLMSSHIDSYQNELVYTDETGQINTVKYDNRRLVKTPGYETIVYDIDGVSFEKHQDYLFIVITRKSEHYSYLIGDLYEKRVPQNNNEDEEKEEQKHSG